MVIIVVVIIIIIIIIIIIVIIIIIIIILIILIKALVHYPLLLKLIKGLTTRFGGEGKTPCANLL